MGAWRRYRVLTGVLRFLQGVLLDELNHDGLPRLAAPCAGHDLTAISYFVRTRDDDVLEVIEVRVPGLYDRY